MISTTIRRARLLAVPVGLLLLASGVLASPAAAHASLVSTTPADGEVLSDAPGEITLTFTESVRLTDGIELLAGDGTPVAADVGASDEVVTITPDAPLADGTYVVGWRVISADSHPIAGGLSFSVGAPSATTVEIATTEAPRDVDLLRKTAEAVRYGGVLVAAGLLPFGLLVAGSAVRDSSTARRRVLRTGGVAAGLAALAAVALAPLTTLWQNASPLSAIGAVLIEGTTWRTETGAAALLLVCALGVAVLTLRRAPALALAAAAVAVGSLAVVGHTRTFGPVSVVLTADVLHTVTAALWAGGIVGLVLLLTAGRAVRAALVQQAVRRFSALALVSFAVLTVSGGVLWWRVPATVGDLPDSSYGVHLIVKVVLVGGIVLVAAWNLRHLRSHRTIDLTALRRTTAAEVALVAVVTAVTAGMVTQVPRIAEPVPASATPAPAELDLDLGDGITATLVLTPGGVGTNSAQLTVVDSAGGPVTAVEPPQVSVGIEEFDLGPFRHELVAVSPGSYEGSIDLPIAGTWRIDVGVRTSVYERPSDSATLEVTE
ncbi:copper resistance CopC/CopD family protein [Aeromicrobium sp. Sec7.5]|uniref:copper resistance CopC/CopD family protein n=1 Tax=Aeromicrobium sp. Sec7.5 TaxID=3121276 RepID=UPI002FE44077